jgi:acetyl/propionyl-CoA carboxylase alpha subunit
VGKNRFAKILIANRGEIALRIIRTARVMKINTVAVYSSGEEQSLHVLNADEAICLGSGSLSETYLNIEKIVSAATESGAQAIHPGYGFLSENPDFAEACRKNGIVFIGPSVEVLRMLGNKITAKSLAQEAAIDVLTTYPFDIQKNPEDFTQIKFPVIIKATHGGGGKGMQVVLNEGELLEKAVIASRSAENYFGNGEIYLEEYIPTARHIEVQVLGDHFGNLIHLFGRDCTIQRNHQKIIEEAPAIFLDSLVNMKIHQAALVICKLAGYQNAGTVEFMVDNNGRFYFLEVNPRIQVEHTVTEQITGIDLVQEQISIAAGNSLSYSQEDIKTLGHAMEVRIYSEDPFSDFEPSGKPVKFFHLPQGEEIRIESDLNVLSESTQLFDPLLGKIIVTGIDRDHTRAKMIDTLINTSILGPKANITYLLEILKNNQFEKGDLATTFCLQFHEELIRKLEQSKKKIDLQFIVAASIRELFGTSDEKGSVWDSLGYCRIYPEVELIIDHLPVVVGFKRIAEGFEIQFNQQKYLAELNKENQGFVGIKIGNQSKVISVVNIPKSVVLIGIEGFVFEVSSTNLLDHYLDETAMGNEEYESDEKLIRSPLHGKIVSINVKKDQTIDRGDLLLVIESMKSENRVVSPVKARIKNIAVEIGMQVADQMPLIYLEDI